LHFPLAGASIDRRLFVALGKVADLTDAQLRSHSK
jgi:hypothetical protein